MTLALHKADRLAAHLAMFTKGSYCFFRMRIPCAGKGESLMGFKYIGRAAACLVFSVAPGLVLANSVTALATCVPGEPVEFDGRHYEVVTGIGKSWDWAKDQAESRTHLQVFGQLATITSAAEDVFVESLRQCAKAKGVLGTKHAAWVGGFQKSDATGPGTAGSG